MTANVESSDAQVSVAPNSQRGPRAHGLRVAEQGSQIKICLIKGVHPRNSIPSPQRLVSKDEMALRLIAQRQRLPPTLGQQPPQLLPIHLPV